MKNLFDYATKELSQDAFLRWLIENYNCESEDVRAQSQKTLKVFCETDNLDVDKISELETRSQWNYIDVLVKFKYDDIFYLIAIEDKVFSEEHMQLDKYNKDLNVYTDNLKKQNFYNDIVIKKIFFKATTLSNGEKDRVTKSGWTIFDIEKIYELFVSKNNGSSDVLNDYRAHVNKIRLASRTVEKPVSHANYIDFIKWQSYFSNVIFPRLSQNGYKVYIWNTGRYPYSCLVVKKDGFLEKAPYLEIRSRDCLSDNIVARILLYDVEKNQHKLNSLKENIMRSESFNCQNYKQQIGITRPDAKAKNNEEFIVAVEKYAKEFLSIMNDWSL